MKAEDTGDTALFDRPAPEKIRAHLRQQLAARPEIDFAYLFGSFLDGPGYHDVDVGVYLHPPLPCDRVFDYEMAVSTQLTLALHIAVDLHVLNDAPLGFQHSALAGELLVARNQERLTDLIEQIGWEMMSFAHHAEDYLREMVS